MSVVDTIIELDLLLGLLSLVGGGENGVPATATTPGPSSPGAEIPDGFVLSWPDLEDAETPEDLVLDWPDQEDAETPEDLVLD
jgi:hypothetical protein